MNIVNSLKRLYMALGGEESTVKDVQTAPDMVDALTEVVNGGGPSPSSIDIVTLYVADDLDHYAYVYKSSEFTDDDIVSKEELEDAYMNNLVHVAKFTDGVLGSYSSVNNFSGGANYDEANIVIDSGSMTYYSKEHLFE